MQYQSTCCHSDNCCKTMSVVLGIKGFNTHFTAENGEFLSHVFRESSRKWISDTWMPRKKNPASRKVRERDGEREGRIEHKASGFRQPLSWRLSATPTRDLPVIYSSKYVQICDLNHGIGVLLQPNNSRPPGRQGSQKMHHLTGLNGESGVKPGFSRNPSFPR